MDDLKVIELDAYPKIEDVVKALTSLMEKSGPKAKFFIDGLGPKGVNIEDVRSFKNQFGQQETCLVVQKCN